MARKHDPSELVRKAVGRDASKASSRARRNRQQVGRRFVPWVELEPTRLDYAGTEVDVPLLSEDRRIWAAPFPGSGGADPADPAGGGDPEAADAAVAEALERLDLQGDVGAGTRVAIKVNLGGGIQGCPGSFTDRELVRGLVRWVQRRGGTPYLCEGDQRACPANAALLARRGYDDLVRSLGVGFVSLSRGQRARITCDGLDVPVHVATELLDPELVIVDAFAPKYHWECGVTLAQKNLYGGLADRDKSVFHRRLDRIDPAVAAAARMIRPRLSIGGGRYFGSGLGPHFTVPVRFDWLVAYRDVVRGDRYLADVMGYPWREVGHLVRNAGGADPVAELMEGASPIPDEVVARIRRHRIRPAERERWKRFMYGQYFVPQPLQRVLYPLAEDLAGRLNRRLQHPKGDPVPPALERV